MRLIILFISITFNTAFTQSYVKQYLDHLNKNKLSLSFVFVTGMADGGVDVLQFRYSKSVFPQRGKGRQFWDPKVSWKNKYGHWMPLSTTAGVRWTDGWHQFKGIRNDANSLAVMTYRKPEKWEFYVYDFFAQFLVRSAGWHLSNEVLIR